MNVHDGRSDLRRKCECVYWGERRDVSERQARVAFHDILPHTGFLNEI